MEIASREVTVFNLVCFPLEEEGAIAESACEVFGGEEV